MDALFIGLGALGTRVWCAFSQRWLTAPVGMTALGLAAAGARAAPVLPPGLLVGVAGEAPGDMAALRQGLQDWLAAGQAEPVVRVVADPSEVGVPARLTAVLDLLSATVPASTRVDLYLDLPAEGEMPMVEWLAGLRARVRQGWLSRAAGATRLARWLLHAPVVGADRLAPAPQDGDDTYAGWDVVERHSDLAAVRTHLSQALQLRLLAQLRFDHWRPGPGYVNEPVPARTPASTGDTGASAWALSAACFDGRAAWPGDAAAGDEAALPPVDEPARRWRRPPRLDEAQGRWQQLAGHYLTLVTQCEAARRPAELRRLFGWGVSEQFDARGLDAACAWPAARVQQRVQAWSDGLADALWRDWQLGRLSLQDATGWLASQRRALAALRERWLADEHRDEALAQRLAAALEAEPVAPAGWRRWLAGADGDAALVALAHRLQAWAMARTGAAIARGLRGQVEAVLAAVQSLHALTEAVDLALATLAGEAAAQAEAALPDASIRPADADRLDTREQVSGVCRTWVLASAAQRDAVAALRADLFLRLGEVGGFRALAEHLGDPAGCAALQAACARRLDPVVVSSVAQTAVQALARHWQAEPAQRLAQLQAWRAQLGGDGAAAEDTLVLAAPLLPPTPPSGDAATDAVTDRAQQAVDALREAWRAQAPDGPPIVVQRAAMQGPQSGSVIWLRRCAPRPVAVRLAERPVVVTAPAVDRTALRCLLLLGEGFGAVCEDTDAQGRPQVLRALLDDAGLELDRVPLAGDWPGAVEALAADATAAQALHQTLAPLLPAGRVSARLRETLQRRVTRLREAAPPAQAEAVGQAWDAAARRALSLLRQDSARTDTP